MSKQLLLAVLLGACSSAQETLRGTRVALELEGLALDTDNSAAVAAQIVQDLAKALGIPATNVSDLAGHNASVSLSTGTGPVGAQGQVPVAIQAVPTTTPLTTTVVTTSPPTTTPTASPTTATGGPTTGSTTPQATGSSTGAALTTPPPTTVAPTTTPPTTEAPTTTPPTTEAPTTTPPTTVAPTTTPPTTEAPTTTPPTTEAPTTTPPTTEAPTTTPPPTEPPTVPPTTTQAAPTTTVSTSVIGFAEFHTPAPQTRRLQQVPNFWVDFYVSAPGFTEEQLTKTIFSSTFLNGQATVKLVEVLRGGSTNTTNVKASWPMWAVALAAFGSFVIIALCVGICICRLRPRTLKRTRAAHLPLEVDLEAPAEFQPLMVNVEHSAPPPFHPVVTYPPSPTYSLARTPVYVAAPPSPVYHYRTPLPATTATVVHPPVSTVTTVHPPVPVPPARMSSVASVSYLYPTVSTRTVQPAPAGVPSVGRMAQPAPVVSQVRMEPVVLPQQGPGRF